MVHDHCRVVWFAGLLGFGMTVSSSPAHTQGESGKPADTLKVSGKRVVFYSVSQAEYDRLSSSEAEEMDEVLSDYQFYVDGVAKWLRTVSIPIDVTAAPILRFEYGPNLTWYFDRSKDTTKVGMILADGISPPLLFPAVDTDSGWIAQITSFYHLR